jgi:hypothetical protein
MSEGSNYMDWLPQEIVEIVLDYAEGQYHRDKYVDVMRELRSVTRNVESRLHDWYYGTNRHLSFVFHLLGRNACTGNWNIYFAGTSLDDRIAARQRLLAHIPKSGSHDNHRRHTRGTQ